MKLENEKNEQDLNSSFFSKDIPFLKSNFKKTRILKNKKLSDFMTSQNIINDTLIRRKVLELTFLFLDPFFKFFQNQNNVF